MIKHIDKSKIKEYQYFITAFSSVTFNKQLPIPETDLDWEFIYTLSLHNNGIPVIAKALENVQNKPCDEIMQKFQSQSALYTVQDVNQMYELTSVMEDFEQNGIYFMPLKGYVIKSDYPSSQYRVMSDCDILFKEEQVEKVKTVFANHGFTFDHFDNDNQYHFEKKPYVYVEMHTSLVNHKDDKYTYFLDIWNKSKPKEGYKYWHQMTCEDFYIFLVEHSANHYIQGGVGLRMLLDMYLYKTKYLNNIDNEYLSKQLKTLGIDVYEKKLWEICEKWFKYNDFKEISVLEEFILLSSTLGRTSVGFVNMSINYKEEMKKDNKKPSKVKFLLKSIFPAKSKMVSHYPYLNKLPFLLPVSWIQMWFKRLFISKNVRFKYGLKNRLNYNNLQDEEYINELNNLVGLK